MCQAIAERTSGPACEAGDLGGLLKKGTGSELRIVNSAVSLPARCLSPFSIGSSRIRENSDERTLMPEFSEIPLPRKNRPMRVAVGCDHRGVLVKTKLLELLARLGHTAEDLGTSTAESCDYPDLAAKVARMISAGTADRGILICGTGSGCASPPTSFTACGPRLATTI